MTEDSVEIRVDWLPPVNLRGNALGAHRAARFASKAQLRESGLAHGLEAREANVGRVWPMSAPIELTYTFRGRRRVDLGNLYAGMKAFEDGLVDAQVIEDDNPDVVPRVILEWAGRGEPSTRVVIREMEARA